MSSLKTGSKSISVAFAMSPPERKCFETKSRSTARLSSQPEAKVVIEVDIPGVGRVTSHQAGGFYSKPKSPVLAMSLPVRKCFKSKSRANAFPLSQPEADVFFRSQHRLVHFVATRRRCLFSASITSRSFVASRKPSAP